MDRSRLPLLLAALIAFGIAALVAFAPGPANGTERASRSGSPAAQAKAAIDEITNPETANPLADIPADFPRVMGYAPTLGQLASGRKIAINPNGGCSIVGGGKPFDLSTVCKAHDLGYDLLRYASRRGDPLGPQARVEIDQAFSIDLYDQCASRYTGGEVSACDTMSDAFVAGVDFNSWRQDYGPPLNKEGMVRTVGVLGMAGLAVYFLVRRLLVQLFERWRRSRSRTLGLPARALRT